MITTEYRSGLMKRVRQSGTAPELVVRGLLTEIGARYRLNVRGLPGRPDIANKTRQKAIFVHGCFWHLHEKCGRGRIPTRNRDFWAEKLQANRRRDRKNMAELERLDFDVLAIWECELSSPGLLKAKLESFWRA